MSGNVTISEAPTTGLGRLITDNGFFVPTHQRDYKWDQDRVENFFDDLTESMDRGDKFYFIGLMVFMGSPDGRLRVLDGQQRLATSLILYSAIRSWFAALNELDTASRLQYDFIGRAEYGETISTPKLSMNLNNDDKFQAYVTNGGAISAIQGEYKSLGKNESNYALLGAIIFLSGKIDEKASQIGGEAKKYFAALVKFMRDSVIVVRLTVPNESNAFKVFETLNDRGMDLSAVDLLKNYLFGCVHEQSPASLAQMEHRWSQLTSTLQNLGHEEFLKVYWTSRHGITLLDDIFDQVKKSYKTKKQAEDLSIDLLEAAEFYVAIDDPEDAAWAPFSDECRKLVRNLKILGSKLARPAILSGMKRLPKAELENLLAILEVVIVRWQLIGEGRTGTIERAFARLASQIWSKTTINKAGMFDTLKEIYVKDSEFEDKFALKDSITNAKSVYIFKKIEEFERQQKASMTAKELSPNQGLTLEHILPQKPSSKWEPIISSDPDIVDECVSRLGNFCLLTQTRNRALANEDFLTKLDKMYKHSELYTTKELTSYTTWNKASIETRQKSLAKKAVKIWKI